MSSSLRDQLLQLGLVNKAQVNEAERQQQRRERPAPRGARPQPHAPRAQQPDAQASRPQAPRPRAGTEQKSAAAGRSHSPPHPQAPRGNPALPSQAAQAAKIARDLALNQKQQLKAEKRARHAEVKQLIERHGVARPVDGEAYNFQDGAKIRQIRIDPAQRVQIGRGELLILRFDGRYHLLPPEIAARVRDRDERIFIHSATAASGATAAAAPASSVDDAYAAFVVPDDLIW